MDEALKCRIIVVFHNTYSQVRLNFLRQPFRIVHFAFTHRQVSIKQP